MTLIKQKKAEIIGNFAGKPGNTGDTSVQIALLTERISYLSKHLEQNKKDYSSKRGLLKLVAQRKKLLSYLQNRNPQQYHKLLKQLNLRK